MLELVELEGQEHKRPPSCPVGSSSGSRSVVP